jgi:MFS transporter, DHA1 family, tetracycline resistance protein
VTVGPQKEMILEAQTNPTAPKAARSALIFIYITLFLDMMSGSLLLPIVPYIVREYSANALTIGLLTVIYSAAAFMAAPVMGWLSDRHGRRPVLLLSVLGSAVGYVMFGIGGALWVLFLSRLIDGLTGGNIATAMAYIADSTQPKDRTRYYAFAGVAFGLGFIMGPVIAGALSGISLSAPAYAAGAMSFASVLFGFFFLSESLPVEKRAKGRVRLSQINPFGVMAELGKLPNLGLLFAAIFMVYLAFSGMFGFIAVFTLDRFQASPADNAVLFAIVGLTQMIGQGGLVYRMVPRFGEKKLALAGLAVQALTYPLFVIVPSFVWLYPLAILSALGNAFTRPTLDAMVANSVSPHEQGRAAGTSAGLFSLTNIFGPLLAGLAYDRISPGAPYLAGGLLLAAACLLIAQVRTIQPGQTSTHPQAESAAD